MATAITDFSKLCVHTLTTRPWDLKQCIQNFSAAGIHGITIWRNVLEKVRICRKHKRMLDDYGMEVVSVARGGFFPSVEKEKRQSAIDDNLRAIEQAQLLAHLFWYWFVEPMAGNRWKNRGNRIREGIAQILPDAKKAGVKLAIEPLHPMYAGDRSAINTLAQANQMAEEINSEFVGVAVDVYHLWWDNNLQHENYRCGRNGNLLAFHICDWNVPTG
jgi:sugar phosphate isomerase/epimerase